MFHPAPTSNTFRGTNPIGRQNSLSGIYPRQTSHVVASHRSGQEENCSKDGYAGSPHEQGILSLSQEWSLAIQAAHSPHDGLCLSLTEVCCPHQIPETAGFAIQESRLDTGAPWYVSRRQIHGVVGVRRFTDIRALTARFDSKLSEVENP